jgi:K(+)-stimulated pyrophosphate-energized sodium pump
MQVMQTCKKLAGYIADGAMAFLKAEWKVLTYFGIIAAAALLAYFRNNA